MQEQLPKQLSRVMPGAITELPRKPKPRQGLGPFPANRALQCELRHTANPVLMCMARIVPTILLRFLHPWRSDALMPQAHATAMDGGR